MPVCIVHNNSKGFTLLEMMIVLMLAGILGAISAPSFMAMNNNSKINDAVEQTQGAFQEAQVQAMRTSKTCIVQVANETISGKITPVLKGMKLDASNNLIAADSCLITGKRVLRDITITNSPTLPWNIYFDYKGRINAASAGTIYFSVLNTPSQEKCITISEGIGLIRIGKKISNSCTTIQAY